jgi:hypothetical protein
VTSSKNYQIDSLKCKGTLLLTLSGRKFDLVPSTAMTSSSRDSLARLAGAIIKMGAVNELGRVTIEFQMVIYLL